MKKIWSYRFDVFLFHVRKKIKYLLPTFLMAKISRKKFARAATLAMAQILADDIFPWSSPNIWREIVGFYRKKNKPAIFEFGMGASTICHLVELTQMKSAKYIGVENDQTWFWLVVAAVLKRANLSGKEVSFQILNTLQRPQRNVDVEILVGDVKLLLHLRPNIEDYMNALDMPCDVIVVDGVYRKKCIEKVMASSFLRSGGMLMLMEAGRGSKYWWEGKLEGDSDYTTEVQTMLSKGGTLIDGTGLDSWPGCKKRSPRPVSYYYPMEACKLIIP